MPNVLSNSQIQTTQCTPKKRELPKTNKQTTTRQQQQQKISSREVEKGEMEEEERKGAEKKKRKKGKKKGLSSFPPHNDNESGYLSLVSCPSLVLKRKFVSSICPALLLLVQIQ